MNKKSDINKAANYDDYGDDNTPKADIDPYKNVEPLPESFRERRDGPGGE